MQRDLFALHANVVAMSGWGGNQGPTQRAISTIIGKEAPKRMAVRSIEDVEAYARKRNEAKYFEGD